MGDPVQLPATVISRRALEYNYDTSLFKRLQAGGYPVKVGDEALREQTVGTSAKDNLGSSLRRQQATLLFKRLQVEGYTVKAGGGAIGNQVVCK